MGLVTSVKLNPQKTVPESRCVCITGSQAEANTGIIGCRSSGLPSLNEQIPTPAATLGIRLQAMPVAEERGSAGLTFATWP